MIFLENECKSSIYHAQFADIAISQAIAPAVRVNLATIQRICGLHSLFFSYDNIDKLPTLK